MFKKKPGRPKAEEKEVAVEKQEEVKTVTEFQFLNMKIDKVVENIHTLNDNVIQLNQTIKEAMSN